MEPASFSVAAPAREALVRWPDAFGTRVALFVDTEEEFDWSRPLGRGGWGVTATAALPDAHRRFVAHGLTPTYLVDYPVASDPRAVDAVRAAVAEGGAVGAQLHPWINPPFGGPEGGGFPGRLPRDIEAAKLDALTDAITAAFGARPLAYRAGRYGIGPATPDLLVERGYRLDSSMRSRYSYAGEGGPDFSNVGPHAFRFGPGDALIELPLTTVFTGAARRWGPTLHRLARRAPHARGVLARAGLVSRVALTPEDMPIAEALEAARVAVGQGVRVLNLSFHSPSLVPGWTPYVRDAADLARFWAWWERMFALLNSLGVRAVALDELLAAAA